MLVDKWIDIHAHFSPPLSEDARGTVVDLMRQACWCIDEAPVWSLDTTLAYMDRTGIQMQMLSNVPKRLEGLRASNDFGADLVRRYPDRFGLLAALPTDDPDSALAEAKRADEELGADGFAVTCNYNGVYLSDQSLEPLWAELDRRKSVVFAHPDAYTPGAQGRPSALIEVAFETTRVFTDMLYAGLFRRFPSITFVVAPGGRAACTVGAIGAAGSGRLGPQPQQAHTQRAQRCTATALPGHRGDVSQLLGRGTGNDETHAAGVWIRLRCAVHLRGDHGPKPHGTADF